MILLLFPNYYYYYYYCSHLVSVCSIVVQWIESRLERERVERDERSPLKKVDFTVHPVPRPFHITTSRGMMQHLLLRLLGILFGCPSAILDFSINYLSRPVN